MPPKAVVENDIETVTFLLAGVRISISARPAAADSQGSVSGFEVVSSAASEASAPDQSPVAPSCCSRRPCFGSDLSLGFCSIASASSGSLGAPVAWFPLYLDFTSEIG